MFTFEKFVMTFCHISVFISFLEKALNILCKIRETYEIVLQNFEWYKIL